MVLSCESGTTERKPQVEQYGLDELAASAEAVLAGLGPLVAGLAGLAVEACGAGTVDAMEVLVAGRGRELLRGLVQLALDTQAEREVRLPGVTGEDGVRRARAEPGHGRTVVTLLGAVRVRRIGYRSGVRGVLSLFPRDAVLNLPPCGYSWALQRLAEMFCRSVSYEQGHEFVLAATGVSIGRRQLEQITIAAAADAERFYRDRDQAAVPAAGEQEQEQGLPPLAISADGKGVAMLPEARRRRTRAPEQRIKTFEKRAGPGRRKAASGWPRPAASSTSPSRTARPGPRSRSCARIPAAPSRTGPGRRTAGTPAISPRAATSPSARSSPRPTAATPATCAPGSRWPTGTTTSSA